jgi:hypothetical protein
MAENPGRIPNAKLPLSQGHMTFPALGFGNMDGILPTQEAHSALVSRVFIVTLPW